MEADANRPDRAREGIQHLQAAARELIHAARALLDVAEDVIDDPAAIATLMSALGAMGDAARRRAAAATTATSAADGDGEGEVGAVPEPTIERITVA
jgi:Mg-chelatase subunit ChlI